MYKKPKRLLLALLAVTLVSGAAFQLYGAGAEETGTATEPAKPDRGDEWTLFRSNSYTMPEPADAPAVPKTNVAAGYEKIGDSGRLALYMNKKTFAIQLEHKASGYVWSSVPNESDMAKERLNEDYRNAMLAPFMIDTFVSDASRSSSNFLSLQGKAAEVRTVGNGVEVDFVMDAIGIGFTVRVALDGDDLVVRLLNDSITETGEHKLASVQLYPYLGSVLGGTVPGYLFIPDGSGALIRFSGNRKQFDEPYVGQIYGSDVGVSGFDGMGSGTQFPVFGIVHGAKRHALMGIIEDGKTNAEIVAYPSGVNTSFYRVSPRFNIRYAYFQPTSKSMGGINMFTKSRTEGDKQVRYRLLDGAEADYAGMAAAYRAYLQERDMLPRAGADGAAKAKDGVPLRIELLGADIEPGIVGRKLVGMTTFADAEAILDDLRQAGITNIEAVLQGWNADGLNGARPPAPGAAGALGGKNGLARLRDYAKENGIGLRLFTDYTTLLDGSPRVDPRSGAARMVTNRLFDYPYVSRYVSDLYQDMRGYLLSPGTALKLAGKDFASFGKIGIEGVAVGATGSMLYSDFHKKRGVNRTEAADLYGRLGAEAEKRSLSLALYMPNDYMLKHTDAYYDMSLYSSQFFYETDTVPFVPMVLHGVMDYFAPYANLNADPELDLLRMIEYGAYPSFIATKEPSWKLQNTPSSELFSTAYADWAPEIKRQYKLLNEALAPVRGKLMTGHEAVKHGVVKVSYEGGTDVWVNYTSTDYSRGGLTVPARGTLVTGGGEGQ